MSTRLTDFYVGTTKKFTVLAKINGVLQDITADTVIVYIKENKDDIDANAKVTKVADVATQGALGAAICIITPADTKTLAPKDYFIDIEWFRSTGEEYILYDNTIRLKKRVSDVPA